MMGLLSTSASGAAGARAAEVFGPRQLVARVIEHVVGRQLRRDIRAHESQPCRQKDGGNQQKRFHDPRGQHASVWKNAVRSFTGQARRRSGEGGSDGSNELLPGRGPLHQKLRSAMKADYLQFDGVVELNRVSHRADLSPPVERYFNFIPYGRSRCGQRLLRKFQYRRRLNAYPSKAPGLEILIDVNYGSAAIKVHTA